MVRLLALLPLLTSVWSFSPLIVSPGRRHDGRGLAPSFISLRSKGLHSFVPRPSTTPLHRLHASRQEVHVTESSNTQEFSVTFPSYHEMMQLRPGEYVASRTIQVVDDKNVTHDFCVLLYPRGGGQNSKNGELFGGGDIGFGMGYKMFGDKSEKVGVYLKYLPESTDGSVDATFTLLLKGQQVEGPKFDLGWSSGMRFVSPEASNLREGLANDFGTHLMQSCLLPVFLGVNDGTEGKLEVKVSITLHSQTGVNTATLAYGGAFTSSPSTGTGLLQNLGLPLVDIRQATDNGAHNTEQVRVGKIVVPVLSKLEQRPRMFEIGSYPGVEYRIMRIFDPNGQEVFGSVPGADYEIRPIYSLVDQLERPWPVRVNEKEIPKLLAVGTYNAISALASLFTAIGGLTTAFLVSQVISLFFIPSKSMTPTLQVKDVLVVEKISPRILGDNKKIGDVVLFSPPDRLREIASSSGGRISDRDLFVKRIAAGPGDTVTVESSGGVKINGVTPTERRDLCEAEPLRLILRYIQPGTYTMEDKEVFVLGDCSDVSVDSRVWGPLKSTKIIGKPLGRIWPLERFGSIPALPTTKEWTN